MRSTRSTRWIPVAAATTLIAAACSSATEGETTDGEVQPLTIDGADYTSFQANFNPYATGVLPGALGFIYEPLVVSTPMQPGESTPWLAESMEFNEDGTVATFTLREGVEWSDGEPFDAEDVAFTFEQMIEHPAMNAEAFPLRGATVLDEYTVEVEFSETVFAREGAIGNTLMVPEHIWAEEEDPTQFTNEDPVGTGPFVLDDFGDQLYTLAKNEDYWDADQIEVEEIQYPANTSQSFTASLQEGEIDWSGHFVANIEELFIAHDPENRGYWYPGGGTVNLTVNHEREIFTDLALREALSLGIDREQITEVAMQGYTPPAHPTAMPLPGYQDYLVEEYRDAEFTYDPDRANQILDEAGYEVGSDGVRQSPDGERLSWEIEIPSDYVDWVDMLQLLEEQYAQIGVEVIPQGVSYETWLETRNNGSFDLTVAIVGIGITPYDLFEFMVSSEHAPDEDGSVAANFGRYYSDEADEYLARFAATDDADEQQAALDDLQHLMVEELPVIPLIQGANWFNYNTENWTGFPNEDDPYARGAPFSVPDNLLIIRNLTPAE